MYPTNNEIPTCSNGKDKGHKTIAILDKNHLLSQPWEELVPGLIKETTEGLKTTQNTSLRLHFRPLCQSDVIIDTHLTVIGKDAFQCAIGDYFFSLGGSLNPVAKITLDKWTIAATGKYCLISGKHHLQCARQNGMLSLSLDGEIVLEAKDPRTPRSQIHCLPFSQRFVLSSLVR